MDSNSYAVAELPDCNFVHGTREPEPALYDGATIHGPWAFMCEEHFRLYGLGLGMGRGQRLEVRDAHPDEDDGDIETGPYV